MPYPEIMLYLMLFYVAIQIYLSELLEKGRGIMGKNNEKKLSIGIISFILIVYIEVITGMYFMSDNLLEYMGILVTGFGFGLWIFPKADPSLSLLTGVISAIILVSYAYLLDIYVDQKLSTLIFIISSLSCIPARYYYDLKD